MKLTEAETKEIKEWALEYRDSLGQDARSLRQPISDFKMGATRMAEKKNVELVKKDKAYNDLGVKFDKEVERWQERDSDELEKRRKLEAELSRVKEVAKKMNVLLFQIFVNTELSTEHAAEVKNLETEFANLMNKEK